MRCASDATARVPFSKQCAKSEAGFSTPKLCIKDPIYVARNQFGSGKNAAYI